MGDHFSNGGEYSRRHHAVLRRGVEMTRAVAIGQCVQGDKDKPELTAMINETCAVDLAELEGDEATGADVCQEYKVPSPIVQSRRKGKGTMKYGGSIANVGHRYAFGNTEELYRCKILGRKAKGQLGKDKPFCHRTGKGCVEGKRGDYYDALANKKAVVVPMIVWRDHSSRNSLHTSPRGTSKRRASARRHEIRPVAHERALVLRPPYAAARSGGAGGGREGDEAQDCV